MRLSPIALAALLTTAANTISTSAAPIEIRVEANPWSAPLSVPSYPLFSPLEAADSEPGVEVQRQGSGAPQTDIRIRGSPFSAAGLTLNGLPLVNPQTEHFHADLPLPAAWIGTPRLLTGWEAFRQTAGHLAGALDVPLAEPESRRMAVVHGGSAGWRGIGADVGASTATPDGPRHGAAAFASWDRMDRTDGQPDNDLERWAGGIQGTRVSPESDTRLDLILLGSDRAFGARGFYGAPPSFPADERVQMMLAYAAWSVSNESAPTRVAAAWTHHEDRYRLDRNDPSLYENRHRTDTPTLHADSVPRLSDRWRLWLRSDAVLERLRSDYSGRLPSTGLGHHQRSRFSAAAVPEHTIGPWSLGAGVGTDLFQNDRPAWHPALQITREGLADGRLFASLTGSARQPSYTELNYESPGSLGNRDLKRQQSLLFEAGYRRDRPRRPAGLILFAEESRNTVDWIRTAPGTRWTAENLGRIRTVGCQVYGAIALGPAVMVSADYLGLDKTSADDPPFASRYVLDYAPHRLRFAIRWRPLSWAGLTFRETLARYQANPARQGTRTEASAALEAEVTIPRMDLVLKGGVMNLWDSDFQTFPGQPPPGREWYLSAVLML